MPHPKLSEVSDFSSERMRPTPLPITNLPVNAITEEADPTLEIRTLIEQLQDTARDARAQLRTAETDRDALTREVEQAHRKIEKLLATERELRSQFTEVTTILRARDAAVQEGERQARSAREAQEKLTTLAREHSEAQRQRDDLIRQRDEAVKKADLLNRKAMEAGTFTAEVQKQLLAIRQARDAAHAQNLDLTNKIARGEDALAELEYQRDAARKADRQAQNEASEYRRQLEAVTADRDVSAKQIEELTQELDTLRTKLLDLAEQKNAEAEADTEHATALLEARAQVASLVQERDAARSRTQEQARELEDLRAQFEVFREETKSADNEAAEMHEKLVAMEAESRTARHDSANLQQMLMAAQEKLASLQQLEDERAAQGAAANNEVETLIAEKEAALTSLNAAHKQIEHIIRERDTIRQRATEASLEMDAHIAKLQARAELADQAQAQLAAKDSQLKEAASRFEAQRLETVDLAAQFQDAHRQIRELSANLAEARLQVRFASSTARAAKGSPAKIAELNSLAHEVAASTWTEASRPVPLPLSGDELLTEKQARSALAAMRNCYQAFAKTPTDLSLLNELYCHAHSFSDRARTTGYLALHRLCNALAALTHGLYETPDQINASTLRTVHQTIDFLSALTRDRNPAKLTDPAKAHVYMVDDDADNCHCVEMVLAEQTIKTHSAQEPSFALMELSSQPFDLIFLDVNMPEMDGFELCRQIRGLPFHATTPIVFLTGLATPENRTQSAISGGTDFIAKPFNLNELSVKALTLILKGQLQPE